MIYHPPSNEINYFLAGEYHICLSISLVSLSIYLPRIILRKLIRPKHAQVLSPARLGNELDLLRRELEAGQAAHVALQALLARARRDGHDALVDDPPQRDVPLADAVLPRQLRVQGVDGPRLPLGHGRQRRVRRYRDVLRAAEVY